MIKNNRVLRDRLFRLLTNLVSDIDNALAETPALRNGLATYQVSVFQRSIDRIELLNYNTTQRFNELSAIIKELRGSFSNESVKQVLQGDDELLTYWSRCRTGSNMLHNEMNELSSLISEINKFNAPMLESAARYEPALAIKKPVTYGKRR